MIFIPDFIGRLRNSAGLPGGKLGGDLLPWVRQKQGLGGAAFVLIGGSLVVGVELGSEVGDGLW